MSPRKITRLALIIGAVSVIGGLAMVFIRPAWGLLSAWPALGLGLAVLLLLLAFLRGAYLTAQKRAALVDMLNDCYTGVPAAASEDNRQKLGKHG